MKVVADTFETPLGTMRAVEVGGRLASLEIGEMPMGDLPPESEIGELAEVRSQLVEYAGGSRQEFRIETSLARVSAFDRTILSRLCDVGYGELVTYGRLAEMAGCPGAARAVGGALNRNPLPIVVPCHRVVAADGTLGGYGGGLALKRRLLSLEGVAPPEGGWPSRGDAAQTIT